MKAECLAKTPPKVTLVQQRAVAALATSGLAERAAHAGQQAPAFRLGDGHGRAFSSREALRRGPIVLVFYRGRWYPYCNHEVRAIEAASHDIPASAPRWSPSRSRRLITAWRRRGAIGFRSRAPIRPCRRQFTSIIWRPKPIAAFIDGLKILRKILAAPELKSYCTGEVYPGSNVTSDEDLLEFCRQTGSTVYHPTSTGRMGNDPLAVVDQRLRPRGIEGLRVVDASIMPDLMSDNTNARTIMIAEKASDMILQDAR